MKREVRISTIQPELRRYGDSSITVGRRENMERMLSLMNIAGERGSDIVLLPETFTHAGIPLDGMLLNEHAETLDSELLYLLSEVCLRYKMHAVVPVYIKICDHIYNSCVFIGRSGEIIGIYHKVHLTQPEIAFGVTPGSEFKVFALDFGMVGAIICHDNSFVESARCTTLMGAEIIFWPHFQSGWGEVMWEIQLKSRAVDNGCIFVSSSYSDMSEHNHWAPGRFLGRSNIVNDDGIIIADCGREVGIATAVVDLNNKRRAHSFWDSGIVDYRQTMLDHRLPEVYGIISRNKNEGPSKMQNG